VNVEDILRESFLDAVQQHKQPDSVGRRLVAWTECLLSGNEDPGDKVAAESHLKLLFEAVHIDERTWETEP
jgi:hypothetical protein